MRLSHLVIAISLTFFVGCAAKEVLLAKSAANSASVDFSGQWQLRDSGEDAGGNRRSSGALVHVFLENGKSLKITQTEYGLFISFDRAIVEEYRFGEQREISVGPIEADRVSGWDGAAYVIETLDKDGVKLIETYRLGDGGSSLLRTISVERRETSQLDIQQAFDRI